MIRVNLLRDISGASVKTQGGGTVTTSAIDGTRIAAESSNKAIIINFLIVVLGLAGGYGYVEYTNTVNSSEVQRLVGILEQKQKEKDDLGPAIKAVEDFKKEKDKVQQQIDTIKSLSRERLRNVKALEALQNIFPERAWLTTFKIDENKAELEGSSTDDQTVAQLMTALDENIFFANVRLIRTSETQSKEGSVKTFQIEVTLEGL